MSIHMLMGTPILMSTHMSKHMSIHLAVPIASQYVTPSLHMSIRMSIHMSIRREFISAAVGQNSDALQYLIEAFRGDRCVWTCVDMCTDIGILTFTNTVIDIGIDMFAAMVEMCARMRRGMYVPGIFGIQV